jgi:hypothetical protein
MLKRGESRGSKLFFFFLFFVRVGASWRVGCVFIHGVTVLRAPGKERERTNRTIDQMVDPLYYVFFFFR